MPEAPPRRNSGEAASLKSGPGAYPGADAHATGSTFTKTAVAAMRELLGHDMGTPRSVRNTREKTRIRPRY